jgi:hypothetical protein
MVESGPKQERSEVEERLPEDKMEMSKFPKMVTNQTREEEEAVIPGLPQVSIGNPTLLMGRYSLVTMPMPGIRNVLQYILPLLQNLPNFTQLFPGAAAGQLPNLTQLFSGAAAGQLPNPTQLSSGTPVGPLN